MIPVWVIALLAALGAVCLALPLHIGMTGICLLLLAAVLLALRILKKKNAPKHWSRLLTGLTAAGMAVIFGAMGYIAMQGQDSVMTQDETPEFVVVLGAQVQGGGPSLTLKKRLDKTLEFMQEHPDRTVIVSGRPGAGRGGYGSVRHGPVPDRARRGRVPDHRGGQGLQHTGKSAVFGEACRGGGA